MDRSRIGTPSARKTGRLSVFLFLRRLRTAQRADPLPKGEMRTFARFYSRLLLDFSTVPGYTVGMVISSIRQFNSEVPFKPYKIQMVSGERFVVPHPDFVLISPKGSFVIVVDAHNCPHHLSSLLIESVFPHNGDHARGTRARKSGKRR